MSAQEVYARQCAKEMMTAQVTLYVMVVFVRKLALYHHRLMCVAIDLSVYLGSAASRVW